MAKAKSKASDKTKSRGGYPPERRMVIDEKHTIGGYCSARPEQRRTFGANVSPGRERAIFVHEKKWVSGTRLNYYFFDRRDDGEWLLMNNGRQRFFSWVGGESQKRVVRKAFKVWKEIGIGLDFAEVDNREDAELRIGFMRDDGAWSYIGRDILNQGKNQRTMNFGWNLTGADGLDTALHEIGHTLGMPHEHQNPNAGIVWDEDEVYRRLAEPPNEWSREDTFHNIIRKIVPDTVVGSDWDRDSIMHYSFRAGMILVPEEFRTGPLIPAPGLSARDTAWVGQTYPEISDEDIAEMKVFKSHCVTLGPGEQFNSSFTPVETRRYSIATFGPTDMVLTLFEKTSDGEQFIGGDDDSGEERNAKLVLRLVKGRTYLIRARQFYSWDRGEAAVMAY